MTLFDSAFQPHAGARVLRGQRTTQTSDHPHQHFEDPQVLLPLPLSPLRVVSLAVARASCSKADGESLCVSRICRVDSLCRNSVRIRSYSSRMFLLQTRTCSSANCARLQRGPHRRLVQSRAQGVRQLSSSGRHSRVPRGTVHSAVGLFPHSRHGPRPSAWWVDGSHAQGEGCGGTSSSHLLCFCRPLR